MGPQIGFEFCRGRNTVHQQNIPPLQTKQIIAPRYMRGPQTVADCFASLGAGSGHDQGWQHPSTRCLSQAAAAAAVAEEKERKDKDESTEASMIAMLTMSGTLDHIKVAAAITRAEGVPPRVDDPTPASMIAALSSAIPDEGFQRTKSAVERERNPPACVRAAQLSSLTAFLCSEEDQTKRKRPKTKEEPDVELDPELTLRRTSTAAQLAAVKKRMRTRNKTLTGDHELLERLLRERESVEREVTVAAPRSRLGLIGTFVLQS